VGMMNVERKYLEVSGNKTKITQPLT